MEYFQLGVCFDSYRELIDKLNDYCDETRTKYWKKDCKSVKSTQSTTGGYVRMKSVKKSLVYYEVKFVCVHSGVPKTNVKKSQFAKLDCPAYFRFKATLDGAALQLVALNKKHNHELILESIDANYPNKRKVKIYSEEGGVEVKRLKIEPESDDSNSENAIEFIKVVIDEDRDTEVEHAVNFTFRGLIAPTLTAFNDDLTVNTGIIEKYAKFLADSGIKGVLVNGTSGEGMSMSVSERKLTTEEWAKAVKDTDQHLMVQVGGAPLPDVLELAQHAEKVGVHSLLCLPDLYNKPATTADLIRYLNIVSQAAPNTPLLYYHIPSYTNVNIHMGRFLNESIGKIPTFHGIKFTSSALDEGVDAVKANDGKYAVFLGNDELMAGAYTLGFDSAIATTLNMFPKYGINILKAIKSSNVEEANEWQRKLTTICKTVTKNGAWVPTMKVAMNIATPINVGIAREPLSNITASQASDMKNSLKGFL